MADKTFGFFETPCKTDGCGRSSGWSSHCFVHETVARARWQSEEDLALLKSLLEEVAPASDEEHHQRKIRVHLNLLEHAASEVAHHTQKATALGATQEQVEQSLTTIG